MRHEHLKILGPLFLQDSDSWLCLTPLLDVLTAEISVSNPPPVSLELAKASEKETPLTCPSIPLLGKKFRSRSYEDICERKFPSQIQPFKRHFKSNKIGQAI